MLQSYRTLIRSHLIDKYFVFFTLRKNVNTLEVMNLHPLGVREDLQN